MDLFFKALPTAIVQKYQDGALDANGQKPESVISDGSGNPCRHCLSEIPKGKKMLILSYRPFEDINPYAETGPIFLCGSECLRHPDSAELPAMFSEWNRTLIRGYNDNGRIVYGTGSVIKMDQVVNVANNIFQNKNVRYIHMRSESYNCYQCKIERA